MVAHKDPDFQARSTETGKAFEVLCNAHLKSLGFTLLPKKKKIKEAGIKVDHVAVNNRGQEIYFEYKGGYEGNRPGLIRTDNTKKMLCDAFLLHLCGLTPFVVMTTAKPREGSGSDRMIKRATEEISGIIFDIIELGDAGDRKRLKELLDMDDFSRPRLPRPIAKVEVAEPGKRPSRPVPSEAAVQVTWYPDLKVREPGKRKRSKVSPRNGRKRGEKQPQLFEDEQLPTENDS
jgi:hypothetical protein